MLKNKTKKISLEKCSKIKPGENPLEKNPLKNSVKSLEKSKILKNKTKRKSLEKLKSSKNKIVKESLGKSLEKFLKKNQEKILWKNPSKNQKSSKI